MCSFTLAHFVGSATSESWDIGDEYPDGGTSSAATPWGYDTPSRRFRTWYDVDDGSGKDDPMNGGEAANAETCFPQFTAYHAMRMQVRCVLFPTPVGLTEIEFQNICVQS